MRKSRKIRQTKCRLDKLMPKFTAGGRMIKYAVLAAGLNEFLFFFCLPNTCTVELQWLEFLSNHEKMFETGVIRANEC